MGSIERYGDLIFRLRKEEKLQMREIGEKLEEYAGKKYARETVSRFFKRHGGDPLGKQIFRSPSADYEEEIRDLRKQRWTMKDIAEEVPLSASTVKNVLNRIGDPLEGKRGTPREIQKPHQRVYKLINQGKTDAEIGQIVGYSRRHVNRLRNERKKRQ